MRFSGLKKGIVHLSRVKGNRKAIGSSLARISRRNISKRGTF